MKLALGFFVVAFLFTDLDKIGKINSLKSEAKKAYLGGDYKTAVEKYKYLIDSIGVNEDEVLLNLANSYFELQDTSHLANAYLPLTQSSNLKIKSVANQQLGVSANRQEKFEEALNYFKQALKADPTNEDARFNYELVKKKLEEQKKQEQEQKKEDQKKDENKDEKKDQKDKENKDQKQDQKDKQDKEQQEKEKKDQEQKEKQSKEQEEQEQKEEQNKEKKDLPPSVSEKLKEMQMSEEKAKMILEAMKNQEVQYLQQNKRKATKPKDKGKPDW